MNALEVKDLSVSLKKDGKEIVRKLSFSLAVGESLIILGQSGCGKTMTCSAVMGLLDTKRFRIGGSIQYQGDELLGLPEKKRRDYYGKRIAFIPQNPMTALDPSVVIGKQMDEMLRFHTGLPEAQRRERIRQVIEASGLKDVDRICKARPHTLSGGMLQRVLIAMALSTDAEFIIADEPTTALDVVHRNDIVDSFRHLRENGAALLFVTHDFSAALRLEGNALIMQEGKIIEQGRIEALYASPETEHTKALVRASELSKGERHAHS